MSRAEKPKVSVHANLNLDCRSFCIQREPNTLLAFPVELDHVRGAEFAHKTNVIRAPIPERGVIIDSRNPIPLPAGPKPNHG